MPKKKKDILHFLANTNYADFEKIYRSPKGKQAIDAFADIYMTEIFPPKSESKNGFFQGGNMTTCSVSKNTAKIKDSGLDINESVADIMRAQIMDSKDKELYLEGCVIDIIYPLDMLMDVPCILVNKEASKNRIGWKRVKRKGGHLPLRSDYDR